MRTQPELRQLVRSFEDLRVWVAELVGVGMLLVAPWSPQLPSRARLQPALFLRRFANLERETTNLLHGTEQRLYGE